MHLTEEDQAWNHHGLSSITSQFAKRGNKTGNESQEKCLKDDSRRRKMFRKWSDDAN